MEKLINEMGELSCPILFYKNTLIPLVIDKEGESRFGGEAPPVEGLPENGILHKLLELKLDHEVFSEVENDPTVLFPFKYDNSELEYSFTKEGNLKIIRLEGAPLDNWPYENFPDVLPEINVFW